MDIYTDCCAPLHTNGARRDGLANPDELPNGVDMYSDCCDAVDASQSAPAAAFGDAAKAGIERNEKEMVQLYMRVIHGNSDECYGDVKNEYDATMPSPLLLPSADPRMTPRGADKENTPTIQARFMPLYSYCQSASPVISTVPSIRKLKLGRFGATCLSHMSNLVVR